MIQKLISEIKAKNAPVEITAPTNTPELMLKVTNPSGTVVNSITGLTYTTSGGSTISYYRAFCNTQTQADSNKGVYWEGDKGIYFDGSSWVEGLTNDAAQAAFTGDTNVADKHYGSFEKAADGKITGAAYTHD